MRERINFNFRIKKQLREDFKKAVTERGFSTCFILETLIQAWLTGASPNPKANPGASLTVNQKIEYLVERPRRRKRGVLIQHLENCYQNTMWTYRRPEKGELLSKLGHVNECCCAVCRPKRPTKRENRLKQPTF